MRHHQYETTANNLVVYGLKTFVCSIRLFEARARYRFILSIMNKYTVNIVDE
jgi:hypothetical protein